MIFIYVVLWFVVLSIGLRIDSTAIDYSWAGISLFAIASTYTNIGLLAILASLIGRQDWESVKRGFTIYALLVSGSIFINTESLTDPSVEAYTKVAGLVTVVCMYVAFKPEVWDKWFGKFNPIGEENP